MFGAFIFTVLLVSLFTVGQCNTSQMPSFLGEERAFKELASNTQDNNFTIVPLIPLLLDSYPEAPEAVGVIADFGDQYKRDNNLTSPPNMFIRISSNETLLANPDHDPRFSGLDPFQNYNCSAPCSYNVSKEVYKHEFPDQYLVYYGSYGSNVSVSFDNSAWSLSNPPFFLTSLSAQFKYGDMMNNTYGWIGLGTDGDAINNFNQDHPLFSISITNGSTGAGALIFGNDTTKANNDTFISFAKTDPNWVMNVVNVSIGGYYYDDLVFGYTDGSFNETEYKDYYGTWNLSMSFDLQSAYFDIPMELGKFLAVALSTYDGIECGVLGLGYYCGYDGDLADLPDIIFILGDGSQIPIPATLYMAIAENVYIYDKGNYQYESLFNFVAPTTGSRYVKLGLPLMANFYTVFERVDGVNRIGLYSASTVSLN